MTMPALPPVKTLLPTLRPVTEWSDLLAEGQGAEPQKELRGYQKYIEASMALQNMLVVGSSKCSILRLKTQPTESGR
ncbi:hypothetical protein PAL_GLEAN10010826 [Pteropus alecto]|uniref:Uncharacterized protein n=1 Tax=Pteropus alecto TaxID=9402 RepID=L5KWK5_PTEAL|nr:hypothetical protein PAL_GLEAN10010826 [Pteropus alecto]